MSDFFEAYFDRVFGVALRLCGRHAAAEDLVQEVFLRVHRSVDRLDPERDPAPWLMTITYNLFRDQLRSASHRTGALSLDSHPAVGRELRSDGSSPDARLLGEERSAIIQGALLRLPEDQRLAVLLRNDEGYSHAQIGEVLGLTEVAARKCYSRAVAALGRLLEGVLP